MRLSGCGLGNCFYSYFHAVVLAQKHHATLIAPPWFSIKLGPLLRGEPSKRLYWRMFKPYPGDIHGARKLLTLLRSYRKRVLVKVGDAGEPVLAEGSLNFVASSRFSFVGLHTYRSTIRQRLLGTINDAVPGNHRWGSGDHIALHIRLGDFAAVPDDALINTAHPSPNLRIPLSWYVNLARVLARRHPHKPMYVFSDGDEKALAPLLGLGAKIYRSGSDITDLLAMAGASILVGSNSTYSRWAAFLGDMPSIWLKTAADAEQPSAPATPIRYVPLDCQEPVLWQ